MNARNASVLTERLFVWMQHGLPQHGLSRLMLKLTRWRLGPLTTWMIRRFVAHFEVNMDEAAAPALAAYPSFNAFFTRALAATARPLPATPGLLVSPVDAKVSAAGRIDGERLLQCKGQWFSLPDLLGDAHMARFFADGSFATLYLSPRDYHRIHMPLDGRLREMRHVPGRLFSVNPTTVARVPGLFARNERVVLLFDTALGPLALVLVGAIFVGCIETVWSGVVTPPPRHSGRAGAGVSRTLYPADAGVALARGEELGRFNMGSTVILLLPAKVGALFSALQPGASVRCRAPFASVEPDHGSR
jgi:phosphatidylserine decarboxylase